MIRFASLLCLSLASAASAGEPEATIKVSADKVEVVVAGRTVTIGGAGTIPTPSPSPDAPAPAPVPAPANAFEALGRAYREAQIQTYADTWEESATMLAAGLTREQVMADFTKRWGDKKTEAYKPVQEAFAKIVPDDVEPTAGQRGFLVQAWHDFAKGLRGPK